MICIGCELDLPEEAYHPPSGKRGSRCKKCCAIQDRRNALARLYGITPDEFLRQLDEQDGLCAACGTTLRVGVQNGVPDNAVVDHDHDTGRVRGILCGHCNRGIGLLGDSKEGVSRALTYLTEFTWHSEWEQLELDLWPTDAT